MSTTQTKLGLRVKWLGCACFELDFGGVTVVSDPWITHNLKTELNWEAVEKCDYITVTHTHYDHILDIPALAEKFNPCILCGEQSAVPLMKWANLNPMKVYPMPVDVELDLDAIKIKATYGRHTPLPGGANDRLKMWHDRYPSANAQDLIDLNVWGDFEYRNFLYTMPNGTKVFAWGNVLSCPEQRNILRALKPDVAILQITGRNDPDSVVRICKEMGCKVLIPHHIDFPGDYSKDVAALAAAIAENAPEVRFITPKYGEWVEL